MTSLKELESDIHNDNLPKNLAAYDKVKTKLTAGMRVGWYFKDDKEFWEEDGLEPREYTQYSGIVAPRQDLTNANGELEAEDCVIVMTNYPCEKEYPEVTWFALRRLLDNEELVEIFKEK